MKKEYVRVSGARGGRGLLTLCGLNDLPSFSAHLILEFWIDGVLKG